MDDYIAAQPEGVQVLLGKMRSAIKKAAPDAETINYATPTFKLHGNLVHFAASRNHIGFYQAPSGIRAFQKELSAYDSANGSVKFPMGKRLPLALITRIVKFRVRENLEKVRIRKAK